MAATTRAAKAAQTPALLVANRLRDELELHKIKADVYEGHGVALVSVWIELVVWVECGPDGWRYRWWTGRINPKTGRWVYTGSPSPGVSSAARRIAGRYRELIARHMAGADHLADHPRPYLRTW